MNAFKTETTVKKNHLIEIKNVPFDEGEKVVIIINPVIENQKSKYPLWDTVYKYDKPFDPAVPPEEWEVLNDPD